MQFEVNGKQYFLGFVTEEGRWFLFTPTPRGIRKMQVVDDSAPFMGPVLPADESEQEDSKFN